MVVLGALAKSWKSGSGAQTSRIDDFNKEFDRKIKGLRAMGKSLKSNLEPGHPEFMVLIRNLIRKFIRIFLREF